MRPRLARPAPTRRGFLAGTAGLAGAAALGGCDRVAGTDWGRRTLRLGEDANLHVQRLLLTPASLAREYPASAVSAVFKPNGTVDPEDADYRRLAAGKFAKYRLKIDGLVEHPQNLSLAELRAMPARTQITRHDCVEGWSCIGGWSGVPLAALLERAGLRPEARFVVFHCADTMEQAGGGLEGGDDDTADASDADTDAPAATAEAPKAGGSGGGSGGLAWGGSDASADKAASKDDAEGEAKGDAKGDAATNANPGMQARPVGREAKATDSKAAKSDAKAADGPKGGGSTGGGAKGGPIRYYESIDLTDAYHPQTILAYDMNGTPLPVSNGAPLRLRVERQLGYKQAKYVMRLEVVDSLAGFGDGKGGYWEDRGYEWYAGI